jgi:uncharacterized protein YaaR (DUF327 family)
MDKVDFSASSLLNAPLLPGMRQDTKKTRAKGEAKKSGKTFFSELLEKSGGELGPLKELAPSEEALTELMDEVHNTGSDLIDRPFHDEIIRYKQAVRNFIHYVVENGYTVEKTKSLVQNPQVRRRETKIHVQIRVIDHKLEELAAAILSGQVTQLERLSKIDEIKGLLVDLTITGAIRERDG